MTGGDHHGPVAQPCLFLLFPQGTRPTAADLGKALAGNHAAAISFEPVPSQQGGSSDWLELVIDGLTFDVLGLSPGSGLPVPRPRHCFGAASPAFADRDAIGLAPGPHLAGAANAMPVVRTMLGLAVALTKAWTSVQGIVWYPCRAALTQGLFVSLIEGWLGGGPFPALGLSGIVEQADGALASDGLAFFTGQEVVLDRAIVQDRSEATRLLIRLVDMLVDQAPLRDEQALTFADGRHLRLVPMGSTIAVMPG